jgi:hypothetical protein
MRLNEVAMATWLDRKLRTLDVGIDLISEDLLHAVALQAMYDRCADKNDVLDALNNTWEAHGFNIVRDSLVRELVMSIMRVHDGGRSDSASLENLVNIASNHRIRIRLIERAKEARDARPAKLIELPGETNDEYAARMKRDEPVRKAFRAEQVQKVGEDTARLLDEAFDDFEVLKSAPSRAALKRLRNWHLAHTAVDEKGHNAKHGDEKELLDATVPVFEKLALATKGHDYNFKSYSKVWTERADRFWKHIARPVASKSKSRISGGHK